MIRFGGPVFIDKYGKVTSEGQCHRADTDDPVALAKAHRALGYTAAYAPNVSINDKERIRDVRQAFSDEGVMIAEVGYWGNLVDTDQQSRSYHRQKMEEALALADELEARCAVNIFGSYCHGDGDTEHSPKNFSKDAFGEAVEMAKYFIDTVKPKKAYFTYEVFPFNIVDSPKEIARLIKAVDRERFGVHLDLVNLINCPRAYWKNAEIMRECISLFGDHIVAAHAKDVKMQAPAVSVIFKYDIIPGEGIIDFGTSLRQLHKLPQEVPYMMEHLSSAKEYEQAAAHIRKVAVENRIEI